MYRSSNYMLKFYMYIRSGVQSQQASRGGWKGKERIGGTKSWRNV